jgi:hypothetical protein
VEEFYSGAIPPWALGIKEGEMMALELFAGMLLCLSLLNLLACYHVVQDELSSPGQKTAQIIIVWCIPIVGALLTLHLKRKQPERASGRYSEESDSENDFAYPLKLHQRSKDHPESESPGEGGDAGC